MKQAGKYMAQRKRQKNKMKIRKLRSLSAEALARAAVRDYNEEQLNDLLDRVPANEAYAEQVPAVLYHEEAEPRRVRRVNFYAVDGAMVPAQEVAQ